MSRLSSIVLRVAATSLLVFFCNEQVANAEEKNPKLPLVTAPVNLDHILPLPAWKLGEEASTIEALDISLWSQFHSKETLAALEADIAVLKDNSVANVEFTEGNKEPVLVASSEVGQVEQSLIESNSQGDTHVEVGSPQYLWEAGALIESAQKELFSQILVQHSSQSEIPIYLLLFSQEEKAKATDSAGELLKELSKDKKACVVSYCLSDPALSQIQLNEVALEAYSLPKEPASLERVVLQVNESSDDPYNQLDRFLLQLSSELFWIEKDSLDLNQAEGLVAQSGSSSQGREAVSGEMGALQLPQKSSVGFALLKSKVRESEGVGSRDSGLMGKLFAFGILPALLFISGGVYWKRRASATPVYFPHTPYSTRLQAPYCGGQALETHFHRQED